MSKADSALIECVDEALSNSSRSKSVFYAVLESKFGVKKAEIPEKFEKFHAALKEVYDEEHYRIERRIVSLLYRRATTGAYDMADEVEAYAKISKTFLSEVEKNLTASESHRNLVDYTRYMQRLVIENTKKLLESERLAVIGQTAGMVGHDLRNPLQSIVGELFLARNEVANLPDGDSKLNLASSLDAIEEQVNYMDKIVSDLQSFVKAIHVQKRTVNLKQLVNQVFSQVTIQKDIAVLIEVNEKQTVTADPDLLKRVLINLVTNAVQAMPSGGKLVLRSYRDNPSEATLIVVEDTGVGIPKQIRPQLFKPLFTTKAKGQGFGLAVCRRVMEAHGGTITFSSQEGKGTKFVVHLPNT